MTQPELNFARHADHRAAQTFRARVLEHLDDGQWHRAKALCACFEGLTDRALRQIAEESKGAILGSVHGYKLTKHATVTEIDHAERQLRSQARKMLGRVIQIRRCRNTGGAAA